jgi:hypothetical protein
VVIPAASTGTKLQWLYQQHQQALNCSGYTSSINRHEIAVVIPAASTGIKLQLLYQQHQQALNCSGYTSSINRP